MKFLFLVSILLSGCGSSVDPALTIGQVGEVQKACIDAGGIAYAHNWIGSRNVASVECRAQ